MGCLVGWLHGFLGFVILFDCLFRFGLWYVYLMLVGWWLPVGWCGLLCFGFVW